MKWEVSTRTKGQFSQSNRTSGSYKKLRKQRFVFIGSSVLVFGLLTIAAPLLLQSSQTEAFKNNDVSYEPNASEAASYGNVRLWTPIANVGAGTKLDSVTITEVYWPRNNVPEGAMRSLEEIRGMFSKVDLAANQPIVKASLTFSQPQKDLGDRLPKGYRAVTIKVDDTQGLEGWATPGAHVDVVLTYSDRDTNEERAQVIVDDAVVISYNRSIERVNVSERRDPKPGARNANGGATVTLAVPLEAALKVQTSLAMGRLSLLLRSSTDQGPVDTAVVSSGQITNINKRAKKESDFETPQGVAVITDSEGNRQQFMLNQKGRWIENQEEEF